ncbi:MAG: MarR family transcriptional regulator, partial [Deltaproteobacteria bacterium]|nr:MarR family transcriptional regulator [Deltaproteobacteria bacterium]
DTGTDPLNWDTDGDSFSDGFEVAQGTDPTDPLDFPAAIAPALGSEGMIVLVVAMMLLGGVTLSVLDRRNRSANL